MKNVWILEMQGRCILFTNFAIQKDEYLIDHRMYDSNMCQEVRLKSMPDYLLSKMIMERSSKQLAYNFTRNNGCVFGLKVKKNGVFQKT
jgi:hypothetical protein